MSRPARRSAMSLITGFLAGLSIFQLSSDQDRSRSASIYSTATQNDQGPNSAACADPNAPPLNGDLAVRTMGIAEQAKYLSSSATEKHTFEPVSATLAPIERQTLPAAELAAAYNTELRRLHGTFDTDEAQRLIHFPPGDLDADAEHYAKRLTSFVHSYFNGSAHHDMLLHAINQTVNPAAILHHVNDGLIFADSPSKGRSTKVANHRDFPNVMFSFDKLGRMGKLEGFLWEERLNPAGDVPQWQVFVGNDHQMERWFEGAIAASHEVSHHEIGRGHHHGRQRRGVFAVVAPAGTESDDMAENGAGKWRKLWRALSESKSAGILRSDLLRYLMMLTHGGLYSDSDTTPLSHPDMWGTLAKDHMPRNLSDILHDLYSTGPSLTTKSSSAVPTGKSTRKRDIQIQGHDNMAARYIQSPLGSKSHNTSPPPYLRPDSPINLVLAVEYDKHHPEQDPREGYTRDLQIAQSTFMARPYHPLFLDVLDTATTRLSQMMDGDKLWQDINVLDVTGPGAFTDAVFRYLLVRYGFNPLDLRNMTDGAIIGDVMILPLHAFSVITDRVDYGWNGAQAATRCVSHQFKGRWKSGQ